MLKKLKYGCLSLLALLCLTATAFASENGYIIRLEPRVSLLGGEQSLPEGVEEVCEPLNLYQTADEALIVQLEEAGLLVYAEPNYSVELLDVPNDPACADGSQWDLETVGMPYAWEHGIAGQAADGTRIRIGIVDSGLYREHEDLQGAHIAAGINILADEEADEAEKTDVTDNVGHGTFIAGTIAAAANNGIGMAGMAPEAELLPVKCFDSNNGSLADIVKGIQAGVDAGCRVLNMSFGLKSSRVSQALTDAINYAAEHQVILVAATGNAPTGSTGADPWLYPAAYDNVIGVGSIDSGKTISRFSYQNETVYITAPGNNLYSLGTDAADSYRTSGGTSFATAEISAAAALALSVDPTLTVEGFMELLRTSAEDLGEPGWDTVYGHGLLRIDRLLTLLGGGFCPVGSAEGPVALVRAYDLTPGSRANAIQVIYDENGAQEAFLLTALTVEADGTLKGQLELPESGRVSLMLLDENWRPVIGRWEGSVPEPPPDDDPSGDDTTGDDPTGDGTTGDGTTDDGTTDDGTTGDGTTGDGTTGDGTTGDGTTDDGTTDDGTTDDGTTDDGTTGDGTTGDGTTDGGITDGETPETTPTDTPPQEGTEG